MGIPELWNLIKEQDRSFPIAQLAEEHYKRHGRPLRIAVDEADWRFNNLTTQQVYIIRAKSDQPAFQGIEKSIFYRICRLLTLNIQLLFVFDGPGRPWKRGRSGGGRIDYEKLRLLKEMLRYFRIPYHEAPGEAEAECARLQILGVVDAVWSQDSDSLMFGCDFLIRDDRVAKEKGNTDRSKENTQKSGKSVKVIRGHEIKEKHNFDREGLVLFAMLCGGDYDMKGLPKCGPAIAVRAIQAGLGRTLCQCRTKEDCLGWREELVSWLPKTYKGFVPWEYPDIKTLNKYNCPKVSTDEQLLNLRGLRHGWTPPINELKLLELTATRFNIWGKLYMNWVGPVLLTRSFVANDESLPRENVHQIKLTKRRVKKNDDQPVPRPLERKLTFSPFGVTTLTKKDFEGERAGWWTSAEDEPFDPGHRVEFEFPEYWLQKVVPLDVLDPPLPEPEKTSQKRKRQKDVSEGASKQPKSPPKRKRKCQKDRQPEDNSPLAARSSGTPITKLSIVKSTSAKAGLPVQTSHSSSRADHIDLLSDSDDQDSDDLQELVLPVSHTPSAPKRCAILPSRPATSPRPPPRRLSATHVIDLLDLDSEDEQLKEAVRLGLQDNGPSNQRPDPIPSRQKPDDGAIVWEDWETNPRSLFVPVESPIRMGKRAVPAIPSVPPRLQVSPHSSRPQKKSPSTTNETVVGPFLADSCDWSFPSPRGAVTSTPIPKGSRHVLNVSKERASETTKESLLTVAASSNQTTPHRQGALPKAAAADLTEMAQIRAARLRHFEEQAKKANADAASAPPATPTHSQAQHKIKTHVASPITFKSKAEIEIIDLTDL